MVRKFSPMELLRPKSLMETISIHFDPDNPRYKFCCESVRATYGAVLVGILELLGAVTFFCQVMIENRTSIMAVSCSIVVLGTTLILVGFLFYGVKFGKAHFVFPHLVFQVKSNRYNVCCLFRREFSVNHVKISIFRFLK